MGAFAHSSDRSHREFLETQRVVPAGVTLKNDHDRIGSILDVSWERHLERRKRLASSGSVEALRY